MSELATTNDEIIMRYRQAKDKSGQVKILAELNACPVERIIGILVASGEDNRKFNHLRGQLKKKNSVDAAVEAVKDFDAALSKGQQIEEPKKVYKKPEIIPSPPKKITVSDAFEVIRAELDDISRQQYQLDMRKADLYQQLWDMIGGMA